MKQTHRHRGQTLASKVRGWGKDGLGAWDSQEQTIIHRVDRKGPPVYRTGNCIQYPMINQNRKGYEKQYIHV